MKNLELNRMEKLNGGTSERQCYLAGMAIGASLAFGLAGVTMAWVAGLWGAVSNSDCF